jgi:hypothetical protein
MCCLNEFTTLHRYRQMQHLSVTPILMFHTVAMSLCPYSSLFHEPTFQVQTYQAEENRDINRSRVSGESSRELNRCSRINRCIRAFPSSSSCDEKTRNECMPASCCGALIITICSIAPSLAGVDSLHKDLAEESKEPPLAALEEILSGLTRIF